MNDTAIQAYAALSFALSGVLAYFVYKLFTVMQKVRLLKGLQIPLDALAGLSIGACFIASLHFMFDGLLKLYMVGAFAGGMFLARAIFGKAAEQLAESTIKGVKIVMEKVKTFFKKVWNKIKSFAESITKGGNKDEQDTDKSK